MSEPKRLTPEELQIALDYADEAKGMGFTETAPELMVSLALIQVSAELAAADAALRDVEVTGPFSWHERHRQALLSAHMRAGKVTTT